MRHLWILLLIITVGCATTPTATRPTSSEATTVDEASASTAQPSELAGPLSFDIVATYPHDPDAFTQGLQFHNGVLYESTGLYGQSDRRIVDVASGSSKLVANVGDDYFAEGLTVVDDSVYQLTWKEQKLLIASAKTLESTGELSYAGEGWGLCHDGTNFVMSNGTSTLTIRSTDTFEVVDEVTVTFAGEELVYLNELECINDHVWANVWLDSLIVRIDQTTGTVVAWVDLAPLKPKVKNPNNDVLNGIAYNAERDTFFVTGKKWDVMYELRFRPD